MTGELLTCLATSESDTNLSLWYHPVLLTAPPIQPACLQESQRAITEGEAVILERKKAKVGKAPSPAAVHSQVLSQGVRLTLLSRSRQTSPAVVAGTAELLLHHGELRGCLFSLRSTPSCVLGCPTSPEGGAPASWLRAEQELSLQELFSALPHASTEPQLFQLASHQGLILKQSCPSSSFCPLPP